MKKVLFLTTLLAVVIGNDQNLEEDKLSIPKGTWNVGGNLTFNTFKNTVNNQPLIGENKTIGFATLPNIGYSIGIRQGITYFVSEGFALAMGIGFLGYSTTDPETSDATNLLTGAGETNGFTFNLNPSQLFFGLSDYF